ncbi:hypothetical protein EJ08DRAFT_55198 [Tothia fuscella]|uniref:Uncharacterized protein n=1 Tax=Tothia fuscella TaxID=1048955 RepID=A0A9P4NYG9_9PEZI|nr:hypothetical protein EJ08DRAFT_55198 [Tothia fuscella]
MLIVFATWPLTAPPLFLCIFPLFFNQTNDRSFQSGNARLDRTTDINMDTAMNIFDHNPIGPSPSCPQNPVIRGPPRSQTFKSTSSESDFSIHSFRHKTIISGTCPKCQSHESRQVSLRLSNRRHRINSVSCPGCGEPWITIGGRAGSHPSDLSGNRNHSGTIQGGPGESRPTEEQPALLFTTPTRFGDIRSHIAYRAEGVIPKPLHHLKARARKWISSRRKQMDHFWGHSSGQLDDTTAMQAGEPSTQALPSHLPLPQQSLPPLMEDIQLTAEPFELDGDPTATSTHVFNDGITGQSRANSLSPPSPSPPPSSPSLSTPSPPPPPPLPSSASQGKQKAEDKSHGCDCTSDRHRLKCLRDSSTVKRRPLHCQSATESVRSLPALAVRPSTSSPEALAGVGCHFNDQNLGVRTAERRRASYSSQASTDVQGAASDVENESSSSAPPPQIYTSHSQTRPLDGK